MAFKTLRQVMRPEDVKIEDGGQAKIWEPETDDDVFVRLQSWDETLRHEMFDRLIGKTIEITINVVD